MPWTAWLLFAAVVLVCLSLDLYLHRNGKEESKKAAAIWSCVWIGVSMLFAGAIAMRFGTKPAVEFLNAYLVEKSLSVDNLFVFLVLFRKLQVPPREQHRVLFWGILGAFATRGLFIGVGTVALSKWHFISYLLGAFLLYTGVKTLRSGGGGEDEASKGKLLDRLKRFFPNVSPFVLALIAIEGTDILFAVDSISAVLAISKEPFIVFTSNVFAILGLRALYLLLATLIAKLKYLHYGLGGILLFVGARMMTDDLLHIPHWLSLLITATIIGIAIVSSLVTFRSTPSTECRSHNR